VSDDNDFWDLITKIKREPMSETLRVRVTPTELRVIDELAEAKSVSRSFVVRSLIFVICSQRLGDDLLAKTMKMIGKRLPPQRKAKKA
jgi:hypothetical protein